jgi:hypothetical protein
MFNMNSFLGPLFLFVLEIFVETNIESCYCELLVLQNMNPSLDRPNEALDLARHGQARSASCCYTRFLSSLLLSFNFKISIKCVMVL